MPSIIEKVTGYITRHSSSGTPELLVFQYPHVHVGVQVPAGTVEPGEAITAAALREMHEETGLQGLRQVCYLGLSVVKLHDDSRALLRDTVVQPAPGLDGDAGPRLPRAQWLQVTERIDGYAEVLAERQTQTIRGWVHADLLADHMERHFFHFAPTAPTPDRWPVEDQGHAYECYWVPLAPRPAVDHEAQLWADEYYEKLLASIESVR